MIPDALANQKDGMEFRIIDFGKVRISRTAQHSYGTLGVIAFARSLHFFIIQ